MKTNSERCKEALDALKSESMPIVIRSIVRANDEDNAKYIAKYGTGIRIVDLFDETYDDTGNKALDLLRAIRDPYIDALMVVMYAGRDEFKDGHPYDEFDTDAQFSEWWDCLGMDAEGFARKQMGAKWPLGTYLLKGAYMFRIKCEVTQ